MWWTSASTRPCPSSKSVTISLLPPKETNFLSFILLTKLGDLIVANLLLTSLTLSLMSGMETGMSGMLPSRVWSLIVRLWHNSDRTLSSSLRDSIWHTNSIWWTLTFVFDKLRGFKAFSISTNKATKTWQQVILYLLLEKIALILRMNARTPVKML